MNRRQLLGAAAVVALAVTCGAPPGGPYLTLSLSPAVIGVDGSTSVLSVTYADDAGVPGKGRVHVKASLGSVGQTVGATGLSWVDLELDGQGKASALVDCDPVVDHGCLGPTTLRLTATPPSGEPASISLGLLQAGQCLPGWVLEGGECVEVSTGLMGLRLELKCSRVDGDAGSCPVAEPTPVTGRLKGDAGSVYLVQLQLRGVVETNIYAGGTRNGFLYQGGGTSDAGITARAAIYQVSTPGAAPLVINAGTALRVSTLGSGTTLTFVGHGGASLTLSGTSVDGLQLRNLDSEGVPFVVNGVPPAPAAFDGQFIQVDVLGTALFVPDGGTGGGAGGGSGGGAGGGSGGGAGGGSGGGAGGGSGGGAGGGSGGGAGGGSGGGAGGGSGGGAGGGSGGGAGGGAGGGSGGGAGGGGG